MLRPSQVLRVARSARTAVEQQQSRLLRSSASTLSVVANTNYTAPRPQRDEWRQFHSTPYILEDNGKKEETVVEVDVAAGDDEIPPWQNPLHHNNPELQKHFAEDFAEDEEMIPNPLPPFEEEPGKALAPPHVHDLAHEIVNLTLLELRELTSKIADHFGFDDDMMAASYGGGMAASGPATEQAEEVVEEKTIFDLKLVGFDAKAKIKVIKEVRAISGLGLKEAKEMVESAPKVLQKDLKPERAEELKAQLEAVGAVVEIV
jgi:large subunit ribosomal protein L7/L12